jgi:pimeloyl-ACP methyl ester carboxylesterase
MPPTDVSIMLVHGAWAEGSSWSKIIGPLAAQGLEVSAPPLPLTSFQEDVSSLERALERVPGTVVLAGHANAGAVIAAAGSNKVRALVYIAALASDDGETVADVFYRLKPDPRVPDPQAAPLGSVGEE